MRNTFVSRVSVVHYRLGCLIVPCRTICPVDPLISKSDQDLGSSCNISFLCLEDRRTSLDKLTRSVKEQFLGW